VILAIRKKSVVINVDALFDSMSYVGDYDLRNIKMPKGYRVANVEVLPAFEGLRFSIEYRGELKDIDFEQVEKALKEQLCQ